MEIRQARFIVSNSDVTRCPAPDRPEYAFIGRSNVGKSSLLNMITNNQSLAKTSGKPGKTQLINHFMVNESWYLVDLPGYGYAKAPQTERLRWEKFLRKYILERINLCCLFVLVDIRHEAKSSDLNFMEWVGENQVPFCIVFTKCDKIKPDGISHVIEKYMEVLSAKWEPLPPYFITSSFTCAGRKEILAFIEQVNATWKKR